MDCNTCYVMKSRRFVGIADSSFEDAADGIGEFGERMSASHNHKVKGVEGTMGIVEKQDLAWNSNLLSFEDDDFLLSGSSKLHASTSGETALSGKMGLSEPTIDRSRSVGTSKASCGHNFNGFSFRMEELKIFSQEVVRFGNRCKDPQWHNLDRYFFKLESESAPQKQLKETAIAEMQKLMALVQRTTELYHELHALDRFEQDYNSKLKGKDTERFEKGDNIQIVRLELKTQRNYVKSLKKRSLWSKTLEEVVEKLVEVVHYIHIEINSTFGSSDGFALSTESTVSCQRLGPAGLALHYANIIIQIYSIVSFFSLFMLTNTREALYQGLPPRVRSVLPNRLKTSSVPQEMTIDDIRARMEKSLKWLVPMAVNTTCARGFLRFSEWAKSGTDRVGRRPGQADPIETLYHADKARTEDHILELVVWLHHLVNQSSRPAVQKTTDQSLHLTNSTK
nr:unnamed protein product [Digitaria exilis]